MEGIGERRREGQAHESWGAEIAADGGSVVRMRKKKANWAENIAKRIPYVVQKERVKRSNGDINGRVGGVKL